MTRKERDLIDDRLSYIKTRLKDHRLNDEPDYVAIHRLEGQVGALEFVLREMARLEEEEAITLDEYERAEAEADRRCDYDDRDMFSGAPSRA